MTLWTSVISSLACGIALAVAAYSWRRLRVVSVGVMAWCALAWVVAKHIGGVRWLAIGWNLVGIADFLISVSMVSLSFVGVLAMQPDPVRIGLHPLALISLFQLPLSIAIHSLVLRRLMSPG